MLSQIREKATGWIAWIIVILISIPFALWGINSYFEGVNNIVVATVNGEEVNQDIYNGELDRQQRSIRRQFGANLDPAYTSSPEFKKQVLDQVIDELLLEELANEEGYRISDQQLGQIITSVPQFQTDKKFDQQTYESTIRSQGYSVTGFEELQRRFQTVGQIRNSFTESTFTFDEELDGLLKLTEQKRTADYVVLPPNRYLKETKVTDEEVEKEYNGNQERYRTPEKIKVEYLQLSVAELGKDINPSEEELKQSYEENLGNYMKAKEERKASHILIQLDADADQATREAALTKAKDVYEKAKTGSEFEQLAKEFSDDPLTKDNGGDLGVVERGAFEKSVENQIYALQKIGEISEPIKSRFGYHVIKLSDLKPQVLESYEDARDKVLEAVQRRQAEARFIELAENFKNLVYEQPDSLKPTADEMSLKLQQSDWFTRTGGKGVAKSADVRTAAFSSEVLNDGLNSEAIEVDTDTLVSIRKVEYQNSEVRPLEEVRTQISNQIKREKSRELVKNAGQKLVERLLGGEGWETILVEEKLQAKNISALRTDAKQGIDREMIDLIFSATRPTNGQAVFGGEVTNSGGYGIYSLSEVTDGDPTTVDDEKKELIASALRRRRGQEFFDNFRQGLRDRAEVEVFSERL